MFLRCITAPHLPRLPCLSALGRRLASGSAPPPRPSFALQGALCSDVTFTRLLGTVGESEVILKDMLSAWMAAASVSTPLADVVILPDRQVLDGVAPRAKGELIVDVRAKDARSNFIVEVQHRVEARFPQRAVLYTAADIVMQHAADPGEWMRPVHTLAFCDYDFAAQLPGKEGIRSSLATWRRSAHVADISRAIHTYRLQPCAAAMAHLRQQGNAALDGDLASRMSFVFALLPHAPPLEDLTCFTAPILRWASLVAHLKPDNIDNVPRDVRSEGVEKLLLMLSGSKSQTEKEAFETAQEMDRSERAMEDVKAEGKAEGMAEGAVEGKLEILRALGITSAASYRKLTGADPPADVSSLLGDR